MPKPVITDISQVNGDLVVTWEYFVSVRQGETKSATTILPLAEGEIKSVTTILSLAEGEIKSATTAEE